MNKNIFKKNHKTSFDSKNKQLTAYVNVSALVNFNFAHINGIKIPLLLYSFIFFNFIPIIIQLTARH